MTVMDLENKISLINLIARDFKVKKVGVNTYRVNPCPICGSKDHFTIEANKNYYSSFNSCCNGGSVYKYLQEVKGLSKEAAFEELKELAGNSIEYKKSVSSSITVKDIELDTPLKNYTNNILKLYNNQTEQDKKYFLDRGISKEIIEKYKLCIGDIKGYGGVRAIIPIWKDGQVVFYNARALTSKQEEYRKYDKPGGTSTFLNIDYLNTASKGETIVITEGEFDALSLETIGIKAIAIGGTNNFNRLIKENNRHDIVFVTAFDNDEAGLKETAKSDYKIEIPTNYKDINQWLIGNINDFEVSISNQIEKIQEQIKTQREAELKAYRNMTAGAFIEHFKNGIKESVNTPAIPTGFKEMDNILDDGFYEGLYILGAISSLGKTSWLLQICDQIAQQGQDILYFSLEMSKSELMAKSISRLTFLNAKNKNEAKTTRGILSGKRWCNYSMFERQLINDCINKYGEYADHLFISEGLGTIGVNEIKEAVKKHIEITGNRPLVVIDYLQILAPYDIRATDKQNTDNAVFELKRISRDYKMPVVAISSLNRANYSTEINLAAFKESGAIEYSSDVLLGLQFQKQTEKDFDVDKEKEKEIREIEVKVLKNRNGATGKTVTFNYHSLFNYFIETGLKDKKEIVIKKR